MPETRDRIVRAAASAFAATGFQRSTVRDVAARARVNEVTIFRYFSEKQQLYWAVLEWKLGKSGLLDQLDRVTRCADSPSKLVADLCECLFIAIDQDPELYRLLNFAFLELQVERKRLWKIVAPVFQAITTNLHCWIAEGQMRDVDPEYVLMAIIGLVVSEQGKSELEGQPAVPAHVRASKQVDLSLFGILPR